MRSPCFVAMKADQSPVISLRLWGAEDELRLSNFSERFIKLARLAPGAQRPALDADAEIAAVSGSANRQGTILPGLRVTTPLAMRALTWIDRPLSFGSAADGAIAKQGHIGWAGDEPARRRASRVANKGTKTHAVRSS
jgi:hypothetical protein